MTVNDRVDKTAAEFAQRTLESWLRFGGEPEASAQVVIHAYFGDLDARRESEQGPTNRHLFR